MLQPAILYKEELNRLFALYSIKEEYKFYNAQEHFSLIPNLHDSNWEGHQFVSIENGQKVLGFMGAVLNRNARFVQNLSIIAFQKNKMVFVRDFQKFIWRMINYHNYHKIRWCVTVGSPHEKTYDKLCHMYGGRIVGVFEKENRLEDGILYNEKHYEIMSDNLKRTSKNILLKLKKQDVEIQY